MLVRTEQQALIIPEPAVQRGPNGLFAYVVKPDATVAVQPLEVLDGGAAGVVVTRGLNDDDLVVTAGQSRLQPGSPVKVSRVDTAPPSAAAGPKS
jgi:multidrug efflux system membrane fusion protein